MHPQKKRLRADRADPRECSPEHIVSAAFDRMVPILARTAEPVPGIIGLEPAVEPGRCAAARIEDERADKRRRAIALLPEEVGEVRDRRRQGRSEIVHPVGRREGASENRRVRDGRDRRLCVRAREDNRFARQPVERRCQTARRSEEAHAVGARGIEGNEDDVWAASRHGKSAHGKRANPQQTPEKPHDE